MMTLARTLTIALCAALLLALPASAKEGVRAKAEGTVRLGGAPGTTIRLTWRLVDARGGAFGAGGIYLRVTRCAGGPRRVNARDLGNGRFTARVVVPKGGIRMLRVGLEGWSTAGGRTQRADVFFAFDPPLVRRCR